MKKGDISITTVFIIFITLASILLLLGLFSTKLPTFAKEMYCKTFFYIHSSVFIPKNFRAEQSYCLDTKLLKPPITLTNETELNTSILAHMLACWEYAERGKYNKNQLCYELVIGPSVKTPVSVTETQINGILVENGVTNVFSTDNFDWAVDDEFTENQKILIEYVNGKIKVT
ncbi:hypothetical protein JW930_00180 [Candidatus Woesearchaeota archaeon]|nr:hypothetical protein [Candidatus Woesearchaeota archaeon]